MDGMDGWNGWMDGWMNKTKRGFRSFFLNGEEKLLRERIKEKRRKNERNKEKV